MVGSYQIILVRNPLLLLQLIRMSRGFRIKSLTFGCTDNLRSVQSITQNTRFSYPLLTSFDLPVRVELEP